VFDVGAAASMSSFDIDIAQPQERDVSGGSGPVGDLYSDLPTGELGSNEASAPNPTFNIPGTFGCPSNSDGNDIEHLSTTKETMQGPLSFYKKEAQQEEKKYEQLELEISRLVKAELEALKAFPPRKRY